MSQRLVKLATSLQYKKYRTHEQLFIAEGEKLVLDLLQHFRAKHILCTEKWKNEHPNLPVTPISETLLQKATALKHHASVLGIFEIPKQKTFTPNEFPALVLDTIQDPGNLGTIIRTASWFGFKHIICSPETADIYNPKVVQATMGALPTVQVHYQNLQDFLSEMQKQKVAIYGTFLNGKSLYETIFPEKYIVVFGNEGQGISRALHEFIDNPITIPAFGIAHPESLNASVSVAVVCSEIARITRS